MKVHWKDQCLRRPPAHGKQDSFVHFVCSRKLCSSLEQYKAAGTGRI